MLKVGSKKVQMHFITDTLNTCLLIILCKEVEGFTPEKKKTKIQKCII